MAKLIIEKREILTKSNLLSLFRLIMGIPIFFLLSKLGESYEYRLITLAVLLITASTDFLDGYLARKYNEITEFGKIVDPLADKVVVGLIILQLFLMGLIPAYYFYLVVGRDLLIFLGGIVISKKIGKVLPSNLLGKITVVFIAFYIIAVVLQLDVKFNFLYNVFLYSSLVLIISSFIGYAVRAKESLNWYQNESLQEHKLK